MKRNWIIWGTILIVFVIAGQVSAMTVRAEASRNDTTLTEIIKGLPFNVDIYMNNNDTCLITNPVTGYRLGYSMPFAFFDTTGQITTISHIDVSGQGPTGNIEILNAFESFWTMGWFITAWSYGDGTLPDSLNFTGIGFGTSGWPYDLGEQHYIRFAFQIDNLGLFCIDSIDPPGTTYDWLLEDPSPDFNGPYCWQVVEPSDIGDKPSDILPGEFSLSQNRPNPFNPSTVIDFALPTRSNVSINIYNVLGQKVSTLVNREYNAGYHKETWDGTIENGTPAASGIYFYKIDAGEFTDTKKMILLK